MHSQLTWNIAILRALGSPIRCGWLRTQRKYAQREANAQVKVAEDADKESNESDRQCPSGYQQSEGSRGKRHGIDASNYYPPLHRGPATCLAA